jgi:hypothetical protein
MIVESSAFDGYVVAQENSRLSIDVAHAGSAMPCLTEKVGGEGRKGLLLESGLDAYKGTDGCISVDALWTITVSDGANLWDMGQKSSIAERSELGAVIPSKTIPVAIKRADGTVVPGTLTAKAVKR